MIGIIGKTKIIVIVILLALIGGLAFATYRYLIPETIQITRTESQLGNDIAKLRSDLFAVTQGLEELLARQDEYNALEANGFINDQDRRNARQVLSNVQTESGVVFAKATVGAIEEEANELADKANHRLLKSPVSVEIDSFDDVDFYEYIFLLQENLPGHVTMDTLILKRERNLSGTLLRQIASGENPKMVSARIEATWTSLAPEAEEEEGQP